jgi:integrase
MAFPEVSDLGADMVPTRRASEAWVVAVPTIRLTKRAVDQLLPPYKTTIYYDADLKGFGLRITAAGARAWIVEYRPHGGGRRVASKRMTIGAIGTLTPEQARRKARELLAAARLGGDPAGERNRRRQLPTLAEAAERFLLEQAGRLKPRTLVNYELYFRRHAVPILGNTKLDDVKPADILRLHRAVGHSQPVTANRVVRALSSLYKHAQEVGLTERGCNPASGLKLFREQARERYLGAAELERLGAALREAETIGLPWAADEKSSKHRPKGDQRTMISPFATAAVRLLLFTGCRLREVLYMRWEDVDFVRGYVLLPTTKTGKRYVVLNSPALQVLSELPRLSRYVIAGMDPTRPRSDLNRPWAAITRHAGLSELRLHDLRHSFASVGAGDGLSLAVVGKLLGHAKAASTERYAHIDTAPLRRASDAIAGQIAAALGE